MRSPAHPRREGWFHRNAPVGRLETDAFRIETERVLLDPAPGGLERDRLTHHGTDRPSQAQGAGRRKWRSQAASHRISRAGSLAGAGPDTSTRGGRGSRRLASRQRAALVGHLLKAWLAAAAGPAQEHRSASRAEETPRAMRGASLVPAGAETLKSREVRRRASRPGLVEQLLGLGGGDPIVLGLVGLHQAVQRPAVVRGVDQSLAGTSSSASSTRPAMSRLAPSDWRTG